MSKAKKEYVGIGRLLDEAMSRKGVSRTQLAHRLEMHVNHLSMVMQAKRPFPVKHYPTVLEVLDLTEEQIKAAQKESGDFRKLGGHQAIDSILIESSIAQGSISVDQLKLATELAEKFGGKLSFRLFINLLREPNST